MNRHLLGVILVGALVFLLAPIAVVIVSSFNGGAIMSFPPSFLTTRWYTEINPAFYHAVAVSFIVATATTALSVPLGVLAALALCRGRFPGRELLSSLCLSPLMVPTLVTGVALYQCSLVFWDLTGITIGGTIIGIIVGHMTFGMPFVIRAVIAGHSRFDRALEDAAQGLGASPFVTFLLITIPVLRPAIMSGAIFAFAMSFDDVPIALFMGGSDWATTLPVQIFTTVQFNLSGDVMAVASLVVTASFLLMLMLNRIVGSDLLFSVKQ